MADDEKQRVENAFSTLVSITEKSGNLRKDLKNDIPESVSTLRKVFSEMKTQLENKSEQNEKLHEEVMKVRAEMSRKKDSQLSRQLAPSLDHMQQTSRSGERMEPPSEARRRKLFSEVLKDEDDKRYKITVKVKDHSQSPEQIKLQMKENINPTDIKVGIQTFKTLHDGRIIIETGSEEEINSLSSAISTKCGKQLEIIIHKGNQGS
jgi:hypothetical protein